MNVIIKTCAAFTDCIGIDVVMPMYILTEYSSSQEVYCNTIDMNHS